jgi:WD40 repeat protein
MLLRIFISYASTDRRVAAEFHNAIREKNHEVFWDQHESDGIEPGTNWKSELYRKIDWSDVVLSLVSRASLASTWCAAEIGAAEISQKRLIPVLLESGVKSNQLSHLQTVDYSSHPADAIAAVVRLLRRLSGDYLEGEWPGERNPFPGLRPFDQSTRAAFFGRESLSIRLAEAAKALAQRASGEYLLIVGPSGCGKSSLVRAGMAGTLAEIDGWLVPEALTADPTSATPYITGLARKLVESASAAGLEWEMADIEERITSGHFTVLTEELGCSTATGRRMLLIIDQFEEMLRNANPYEKQVFRKIMTISAESNHMAVATLGSAFLLELELDEILGGVPRTVREIGAIPTASLPLVIERPAQRANLRIGEELVARIAEDTGGGEALPLLAFTLQRLAAEVSDDRTLTEEMYESIGGVRNALSINADVALQAAVTETGLTRARVVAILTDLATIDDEGRAVRRRVSGKEMSADSQIVYGNFVDQRLVVSDRSSKSEDGRILGYSVAHEALLNSWAPLAEALQEHRLAIRARTVIEKAASRWSKGRPDDLLLEGRELARLAAEVGARQPLFGELETENIFLDSVSRAFLGISLKRARRRRTSVLLSALLVAVLTTTAAGIALIASDRAASARREKDAQLRVATAHGLTARADTLRSTDPILAMKLGLAAQKIVDDDHARAGLVQTMLGARLERTLVASGNDLTAGVWSPDGRRYAEPGWVSIDFWSIAGDSAKRLSHLEGEFNFYEGAWSPDSRYFAASAYGITQIYDATNSEYPTELAGDTHKFPEDNTFAIAWASSGILATGTEEGRVKLWRISAGRSHLLDSYAVPGGERVAGLGWSADGRRLAVGDYGGGVRILRVSSSGKVTAAGSIVKVAESDVRTLSWKPSGTALVTGAQEPDVSIMAVSDLRVKMVGRGVRTPGASSVDQVIWSPSGGIISVVADDRLFLRLISEDLSTITDVASPAGTSNVVSAVSWRSDGAALYASIDGGMTAWGGFDRISPPLILGSRTGKAESSLNGLSWSPGGDMLAAITNDGQLNVWSGLGLSRRQAIGIGTSDYTEEGSTVDWSADGSSILAVTAGKLSIWTSTAGRFGLADTEGTIPRNGVSSAEWSPSGRFIAVTKDDGVSIYLLGSSGAVKLGPTTQGNFYWLPDNQFLTFSGSMASLLDTKDHSRSYFGADHLRVANGQIPDLSFSPQRNLIVTDGTGNGSGVELWDGSDIRDARRVGQPLAGQSASISAVSWDPSGHFFALQSFRATDDNQFDIWNVTDPQTPRHVETYKSGRSDQILAMEWSPDGKAVATGAADGTITIWNVQHLSRLHDNAYTVACEAIGTGLTQAEWRSSVPGIEYMETC